MGQWVAIVFVTHGWMRVNVVVQVCLFLSRPGAQAIGDALKGKPILNFFSISSNTLTPLAARVSRERVGNAGGRE